MGRAQLCAAAMFWLAVPAMADTPALPLEPVRLFRDVCTNGQGRLGKDIVRESSYFRMPPEARGTLDYAAPGRRPNDARLFPELGRADVPNRVLMLGDRNLFLMLPAPGQRGAFASSCAVVWKGTDFQRSRDAILNITGASPAAGDESSIMDVHDYGLRSPHYSLRTVEMDGWTMLLETPYAGSSASMPTSYSRPVAGSSGVLVRDKGDGETIVKTNHQ